MKYKNYFNLFLAICLFSSYLTIIFSKDPSEAPKAPPKGVMIIQISSRRSLADLLGEQESQNANDPNKDQIKSNNLPMQNLDKNANDLFGSFENLMKNVEEIAKTVTNQNMSQGIPGEYANQYKNSNSDMQNIQMKAPQNFKNFDMLNIQKPLGSNKK